MTGAIAAFMAVLVVGLFVSSLSQGGNKASTRLSSILKNMEKETLDPTSGAVRRGAIRDILKGSKYSVRKKAEKELVKILRYAIMVTILLFSYTFVLAKNPPTILKAISVFAMVGSFLPMIILKKAKTARLASIEKSLINVIDLIIIGLEAGMTLPSVITEIIDLSGNKKDPLMFELDQMIAELDAGLDMNSALRGLAVRCEIPELHMLSSAVSQADRVGSGLSETFRIYGDELRSTRREKIRTKIQKIPIKMLGPMVIFLILPFLVVVLAPAMVNMGQVFSSM